MINCAIVIIAAAEEVSGGALRKALPDLAGRDSNDLICLDCEGKGVQASGEWSIAAVWDYPDGETTRLQAIACSLKDRLQQVGGNGYGCIIWHKQSASQPKKNAFTEGLAKMANNLSQHEYTRQGGDKLYEAILAVLNGQGSHQNFVEAVNRLCAHLVPVYQWAIDILSVFLPADLAWQVDGVERAKETLSDGQLRRHVSGRFHQLEKALENFNCGNHETAQAVTSIRAYLQDQNGRSLYDKLDRNPKDFHAGYIDLRDQLFVLVERVERTRQGVA